MSLNKFTDVEKGKALGLRIGCEVLECTNCICDSMTFPAGGDLNAHDVNVSNNLKVATSNGEVNYTTPDKGQPNYSLHTDGAGGTFWSPDDTGSADLTYNGTTPVALGQHVKFSNTDSSTVNESKLIEGATSIDFGGLNLNCVGLINGNPPLDLTNLESKTQNIDLAGTVSGNTQLNGNLTMAGGNIRVEGSKLIFGNGTENSFISATTGSSNERRVRLRNLTQIPNFEITQPNAPETASSPCSILTLNKNTGPLGGVNLNFYYNGTDISTPNAGGRLNHLCFTMTGSPCEFAFFEDQSIRAGNLHYDQGDKAGVNNNGLKILDTTVSTSTTTGAIQCSGGVGIDGNLSVSTINNLTPAAGSFAQTSSVVIVNTTTESTILGSGQGSLSVPADRFRLGGSYRISAGGVMSCLNNTDLTIRLYGGPTGNTLLGTIPTITISTSTGKWWGLECYFTIRALGAAGVGVFSFRAKYEQNVDSQNGLIGQSVHSIESTNFDTTVLNTLNITAQWGTASPSNTFTTTQCVLYVIW